MTVILCVRAFSILITTQRKTLSRVLLLGPPRFSDTLPGKVTGFLGKTTKLLCDVVGFPTPVVEWNMSPPAPLPQSRSSLTNGSLFIENIKSGDEGVYLCTARNEHGMVIHGTFLKVESVGELCDLYRLREERRNLWVT